MLRIQTSVVTSCFLLFELDRTAPFLILWRARSLFIHVALSSVPKHRIFRSSLNRRKPAVTTGVWIRSITSNPN